MGPGNYQARFTKVKKHKTRYDPEKRGWMGDLQKRGHVSIDDSLDAMFGAEVHPKNYQRIQPGRFAKRK